MRLLLESTDNHIFQFHEVLVPGEFRQREVRGGGDRGLDQQRRQVAQPQPENRPAQYGDHGGRKDRFPEVRPSLPQRVAVKAGRDEAEGQVAEILDGRKADRDRQDPAGDQDEQRDQVRRQQPRLVVQRDLAVAQRIEDLLVDRGDDPRDPQQAEHAQEHGAGHPFLRQEYADQRFRGDGDERQDRHHHEGRHPDRPPDHPGEALPVLLRPRERRQQDGGNRRVDDLRNQARVRQSPVEIRQLARAVDLSDRQRPDRVAAGADQVRPQDLQAERVERLRALPGVARPDPQVRDQVHEDHDQQDVRHIVRDQRPDPESRIRQRDAEDAGEGRRDQAPEKQRPEPHLAGQQPGLDRVERVQEQRQSHDPDRPHEVADVVEAADRRREEIQRHEQDQRDGQAEAGERREVRLREVLLLDDRDREPALDEESEVVQDCVDDRQAGEVFGQEQARQDNLDEDADSQNQDPFPGFPDKRVDDLIAARHSLQCRYAAFCLYFSSAFSSRKRARRISFLFSTYARRT